MKLQQDTSNGAVVVIPRQAQTNIAAPCSEIPQHTNTPCNLSLAPSNGVDAQSHRAIPILFFRKGNILIRKSQIKIPIRCHNRNSHQNQEIGIVRTYYTCVLLRQNQTKIYIWKQKAEMRNPLITRKIKSHN